VIFPFVCSHGLKSRRKIGREKVKMKAATLVLILALGLAKEAFSIDDLAKGFDVQTCPKNMVFTECLSACPKVCGQPEPEICVRLCAGRGCECPPHRPWFHPRKKKCFKSEDQCPRKPECPKNQSFFMCEPGCRKLCNGERICVMLFSCNPGCFCRPDQFIGPDGSCFDTMDECPAST